jgi:hypothetical protein
LSIFFTRNPRTNCNAASAYMQAFELYGLDRDLPKLTNQQLYGEMLKRQLVRAAVVQVTSGTDCRPVDFLPYLPDDLSRQTKFPYLEETQVLAKLLDTILEMERQANRADMAVRSAQILMSFGRHLRESALVVSQELQGIAIERLAARQFRRLLADKDPATSAKLALIERLLDQAQTQISDTVTSHRLMGEGLSADLVYLQSRIPVFRCEAILNMAAMTFPPEVLIKPTPGVDLQEIVKRLDEAKATSATKLSFSRKEFERRISWPRRGVREGVALDEVRTLRKTLEPVAKSDPDRRVRVLAQRFLNALVDPAPTPRPPAASRTPAGMQTPAGRTPTPRPGATQRPVPTRPAR